MKHLKSQRGMVPLVEVLVLALVLAAGAAVYVRVQNNNKSAKVEDSGGVKKKAKPVAAKPADPTADWTTYMSNNGKFSFRYKPTWQIKACERSDVFLELNLYQTLPGNFDLCNSGDGAIGKVFVASVVGDKRSLDDLTGQEFSYSLGGPDWKIDSTETVQVSGVTGKRYSGKISETYQMVSPPFPGASQVLYSFYTGGRTYSFLYTQRKGEANEVSDFDLMVKNTLKFSAS